MLTRPAALVRQGSLKLYTTSLRVSDLKRPKFYTISALDPEGDGPGYQRLLNESRAKKLAQYLIDGHAERDAFLPTSVFLATNHDIPFDTQTNTITFDVHQTGPFNVVDGQHRIAGLVLAADENPDLLEFEIPVNIGVALDDISQMCHFLIVNTTQKSVDKSVEQQIVARLTKMIGLEKIPTIPRWIRRQIEKGEDARALGVVDYLNAQPGSAWLGKVRMANDDSEGTTINQKSFVTSLKKYIFAANNPLSNPEWDDKRPMILFNYWNAVTELLVDSQNVPSVIYKTNGVDLFHIASATVFTHLAARRDFTRDAMRILLQRGFANLPPEHIGLSHPEFWRRGGAAGEMNSGAIRKMAMTLSHALNVQGNADAVAL
jgi:DGQHR domain-containing protein